MIAHTDSLLPSSPDYIVAVQPKIDDTTTTSTKKWTYKMADIEKHYVRACSVLKGLCQAVWSYDNIPD